MKKQFPKIIALIGSAGAGKSTVARYLNENYGYQTLKFAGPLKDMLRAIGLTDRELEGDLKEQPCYLLCGRTPRQAMVTLGTEWARDHISQDLWTSLWQGRAQAALEYNTRIVVDDCRFENELDTVLKLGGEPWRIVRPEPSLSSIPEHASEHGLTARYNDMELITNDGTLVKLQRAVDFFLRDRIK